MEEREPRGFRRHNGQEMREILTCFLIVYKVRQDCLLKKELQAVV